jgi:hypothetical protein
MTTATRKVNWRDRVTGEGEPATRWESGPGLLWMSRTQVGHSEVKLSPTPVILIIRVKTLKLVSFIVWFCSGR